MTDLQNLINRIIFFPFVEVNDFDAVRAIAREALAFTRPIPAERPSGPFTTEQLDKLQFGKVLHERPSESAVAWRTPLKTGYQLTSHKDVAEQWRANRAIVEPLYAIPHGDAVRESTETSDEYTKLADEVQEMIETDDMAEPDVAKAKLTLTALREAASRLASERVSERETAEDNCACGGGDLSGHDPLCPERKTMTRVPADRVIGDVREALEAEEKLLLGQGDDVGPGDIWESFKRLRAALAALQPSKE